MVNQLSSLDSKFCRNMHLLNSSKQFAFDADNQGNLYRLGKIKMIWLVFINLFSGGRDYEEMNIRVGQAIDRTLFAVEKHLEQVAQYVDENADCLASRDSAFEVAKKLYVVPNRHFRVEAVKYESLFRLDLNKVPAIAHEQSFFGKSITQPLKYVSDADQKMENIRRNFAIVNHKVAERFPQYDISILGRLDSKGQAAFKALSDKLLSPQQVV